MSEAATELPGPLPCPYCGKRPLASAPDNTGMVYIQCLTRGCVTYGDIKWRLRLDLWNTRGGEADSEAARLELKRLAEIGGALLRQLNLPLTVDNGTIGEALNIVGQAYHESQYRRHGVSYGGINARPSRPWQGVSRDDMSDTMRYAQQGRRGGKQAQQEIEELQRRYIAEMRAQQAKKSSPLPLDTKWKGLDPAVWKKMVLGDWDTGP